VKEDLRGEISGEGFEKFKTKQKMDIGFLFYFYFREKMCNGRELNGW